jgi:hypothetical protein
VVCGGGWWPLRSPLSLCVACGGGGVVARRQRHGGAAACVRRRRAVGAAAPPALFLFQNTPSPRANMASGRTFTERGTHGSRRRVLRRYSVRREAFTESKLSVKASVRGKGPSPRGIPLSTKTSNPVVEAARCRGSPRRRAAVSLKRPMLARMMAYRPGSGLLLLGAKTKTRGRLENKIMITLLQKD